jgi:lysophospholipase L1-like esterase
MKPLYLLVIPAVILTCALISGVILFRNVANFTNYWQSQNTKEASGDAIVYVALGDSAAQGLGASTPDKGYVGQFAKQLSQKEGRPVHLINLSKSGARIKDVLNDQLPELAKLKPNVVTIDIGGNDIADYQSDKFRDEFSQLLGRLPAGTFVANLPYFGGRTQLPFFGNGQPEQDVLEANLIIAELIAPTSHHLVELHDITKLRNARRIWNYAIDYFHPNNRGYKAWTEAYWATYTAPR